MFDCTSMEEEEVPLETSSRDWLQCSSQDVGGATPEGRYGCSATLVGDNVFIFGGNAAGGAFIEDLLVWTVERGRFQEPRSGVLEGSGRGHHAACAHEGRLWVFGGKANGYKNDLQVYEADGERVGWRQVAARSKAVPEARYGMAACVAGGEWLVHGGYDSDALLCADLWSFSFAGQTWQKRQTTGAVPSARMHHAMAATGDGRVVLFGGKEQKGPCAATVHVLEVGTGAWSELKRAGRERAKGRAKKGAAAGAAGPAARWGHSATLVALQQGPAVVVYGGRDQERVFGDAWLLDVAEAAWEELPTATAPEPRVFHAATMVGEQLLVFGGMNLENQAFATLFKLDVARECFIAQVSCENGKSLCLLIIGSFRRTCSSI